MQKINFLPQVKAWNAIEFGGRRTWTLDADEVGMMTYDPSIDTTGSGGGTFMVSVPGKQGARWAALLITDEDNTTYDTTYMKRIFLHNKQDDTYITFSGDSSIYTQSKYSDSSNPLATMADVRSAISSSTILGAYMDATSIVDSSYIHLYSDPSSLYNASTNQLATIGTVTNAIAAIGTVLELRRVYDPNNIPVETVDTITEFEQWLTYCDTHATNNPSYDYYLHDDAEHWNVEKGDVVIWGNQEYVYIGVNPGENGYDPSDMDNWELFGTLDTETAVTSFGGCVGAIAIDASSFYMSNNALKLYPADATHLGGVMTGYTDSSTTEHVEGIIGSANPDDEEGWDQTHYQFGLDVSAGSEDDTSTYRAFTSIPLQSGHVEAGLLSVNDYKILHSLENSGVFVAAALIDPLSLAGNQQYNSIYRVIINHNFGQAVMQIGVYKNREYGRDASNNAKLETISKQMVYTDEIIADSSTVLIDFGSPQAFIGCQDSSNGNYYGYTVVMTVPNTHVQIPDASVVAYENPV